MAKGSTIRYNDGSWGYWFQGETLDPKVYIRRTVTSEAGNPVEVTMLVDDFSDEFSGPYEWIPGGIDA